MVQFYPCFKFYFPLFQTYYHVIVIHYHTQKRREIKFKPGIKLNHNVYQMLSYHLTVSLVYLIYFYQLVLRFNKDRNYFTYSFGPQFASPLTSFTWAMD